MDRIAESIFKKKAIIFDKLIGYGFAFDGKKYIYHTKICDGQMSLDIVIDKQGDVSSMVIDLETDEPYTLFLVEDAVGSFVGQVREEYERVLADIADKCAQRQIFKSEYAQKVIEYIRNKYGDELEFLWEKFDDNAIWRRKDNKKWYGLILILSKRKLGLDSDEKVEIMDFRIDPKEVDGIIDNKKYFSAYHMNKKSWITICLDGSIELDEIYKRIDESYKLALKK